ncbi:MAG: hypothetical protein E6I03_00845 [Chloroflexi bacterium]|nr:MAG: hypothetical protein E6I03_00845 [Chloroflexota bacterium]
MWQCRSPFSQRGRFESWALCSARPTSASREEELRPRGAAPAAEAGGLGEIVAARVEDADIDDVSGAVAERRGDRIGIAIRNVDTGGVRRDVEGEVKVGLLPDLLRGYVALEADRF